uniref:Uncharacterized protein n=1 Tax=Syphacia muris TaxID=451379 RepID=A0A0N5B195_9BILA
MIKRRRRNKKVFMLKRLINQSWSTVTAVYTSIRILEHPETLIATQILAHLMLSTKTSPPPTSAAAAAAALPPVPPAALVPQNNNPNTD